MGNTSHVHSYNASSHMELNKSIASGPAVRTTPHELRKEVDYGLGFCWLDLLFPFCGLAAETARERTPLFTRACVAKTECTGVFRKGKRLHPRRFNSERW